MCGIAKKQRPLNLGEYALKYGQLAAAHAQDQIKRQESEKRWKQNFVADVEKKKS